MGGQGIHCKLLHTVISLQIAYCRRLARIMGTVLFHRRHLYPEHIKQAKCLETLTVYN